MVQALGLHLSDEDTEAIAAYESALATYYQPYVEEHPHILENYLVNQVLASYFPFEGNRSFFDEYVMLVVRYALVKLHLVGVAAYERRLDDSLVVEVIQSFQRAVDHDERFLQHALDLLRLRNITSMAHMAILIVS